ncbi:type II toxin-antitoxin system VapC family toxin [Brevundimonas sp. VNH65]|uniref:type II toxin-antitoxin system VapC family toxin n=1 Tax=Brevundimonas sp. VNH65 TaxID=3400917 RepID=UPI003C0A04CD
MFLDASALTAMLSDENDAHSLYARMEVYPHRTTSPMAVWETVCAVARRLGLDVLETEAAVETFLKAFSIEVQAIPPEIRHDAIAAHARFGKGLHPAALNFGDCFAYACARHANAPLLYKGEDFAQTDIEAA